jgi:hypothetical protein
VSDQLDPVTVIADILGKVNSDWSSYQQAELLGTQGKLTEAEGNANQSLYEQYLKDFPTYEAAQENQYQVKEAQTLGERLVNMGMRGISTGGAGAATSGAAVYTEEKSLYDQGYQVLVNQLDLQKTEAQGKLAVAQATVQAATEEQDLAKKGQGGAIGGGIGTVLGGIAGAVIGSFIPGAGTLAGAAIGADLGGALGTWLGSL